MLAIRTEAIADLDRHGEISIEFDVSTVLDVELVDGGLGGVVLNELTVDSPWVKGLRRSGWWPDTVGVSVR
jgi:hypothetical protein